MGFLHSGVCYETYDQAMSIKFGGDPVLEVAATNGTDKIHFYEIFNGGWVWSEYATSGGAWTLQYHSPLPQIIFPACTFDPTIPTLQNIFAMPLAADVATIWGLGFVVPVALYIAAWAYGQLNGMWKHHPSDDC